MAGIQPFLKNGSFDIETMRVMGEAYDHAAKHLHDKGQPLVVQEVIAKRIIELAGSGQHDPKTLAEQALESLGIASRA